MPIGRRFGRPGLIGTAARTAVIAGTAQATAGAIAHRQQNRWAEQQADSQEQVVYESQPAPPLTGAPAPAAPSAGAGDLLGQIQQLAQLHAAGVLTAEEFAAAKAKLLA